MSLQNYKRPNPIFVLSVIFIILTALVFIDNPKRKQEKKIEELGITLLQNVNAENINKIEIIKNNKNIHLEKKDIWNLTAPEIYPADESFINESLNKIINLKTTSPISQNKEKHDAFEVTAEKGTKVKIYDNKNLILADFYIGKTGSTWNSSYIRLEGNDTVYLTNEELSSNFPAEKNEWKDKTVISFDPEKITEFAIINENQKIAFKKDEENWLISEPEQLPANKEKIEELLSALKNLKTNSFQSHSEEIKEFSIKIYLKQPDSLGKSIYFIKNSENEDQYNVKTENQNTLFEVNKSATEILKINLEEYKN